MAGATTTTVYLLRHGETEANSKGVLQGQSESPLTQQGRSQAAALGAALCSRVPTFEQPLSSTVYSSDLSRASDTAQAVIDALSGDEAASFSLKRDARLRERRLGPFQGLSVSECHRQHAVLWSVFNSGEDDQMTAACASQPGANENGGVEMRHDMTIRAVAVMREIAAAHPGESVLVVSHGGFIHHAVCAMSNLDEGEVPHIGNCTVTTLIAPAASSDAPWQALAVGEHAAHRSANNGVMTGGRPQLNVDLVGRGNIKAGR